MASEPRRLSSMTLQATHVYIPDEQEVWVDCIVQGQIDENTIRVCDAAGNMHSVSASSCLSGITYPDNGFSDMTTMSSLHEASVLQNLRLRFHRQLIYTKIADILVSVNPFAPVSSYDDAINQIRRGSFQPHADGNSQPHIYGFADDVYRQMRTNGRNQAVIISGESGAGKTEANKFIVKHLSKESANSVSESNGIDKRVVSTSSVLEAFGNAKTVRNHNSSRFGKLFECQFNRHGSLVGAKFEFYLLEKSRVSVQNTNERNFHIFYYILAGASKDFKKKWRLPERNSLSYLSGSNCYEIPGEDPVSDYQSLLNSMLISGFTKEECDSLMETMCAILHLGNIKFSESESAATNVDSSLSGESLLTISEILGCPAEELSLALTKRVSYVRDETVFMQNDKEQASSTRDTLAQQLYERCFQFIIRRLNQEFESDKHQVCTSVLLLDIFGFESFKANSFEQLCINYANERLQLLFNDYMFKFELDAYAQEGIDIGHIVYHNNQPCIDLFEQVPLGLIRVLDEESKFPKGTDASLLAKMEHNFSGATAQNAHFIRQRFGGDIFSIKHYCGTVAYTVTGFLVKNRQQFSTSLTALIAKCQSIFIVHLFDDIVAATRQSPSNAQRDLRKSVNVIGTSKKTLVVQFYESLIDLTARLSSCDPHFVRCIKSNSINAPLTFDSKMVAGQLRDIGIVEAIRIRSDGYPQRHSFDSLFRRFGTLCPQTRNQAIPQEEQLAFLFQYLGIEFPSPLVQIGKSKVFFKASVYERLEALVGCVLAEMATKIQRHVRGMQSRNRYRLKRKACSFLQQLIRKYLFIRWSASVTIQSLWRGHSSRLKLPKPVQLKAVSHLPEQSDPASVHIQVAAAISVLDQEQQIGSLEIDGASEPEPLSSDDPLPELDGLPIEAKHLIKAVLCNPGTSADFPILLKNVLDKATADRIYAESIARCRHLRHVVLLLGSDAESMKLLYVIATSTGNVARFINAGGMIKVKEAMFTSCSKPTVFDDGEAEIALKILQHVISLPAGPEAIAEDVEIVKGITICLYCRPNDISLSKHCSSVLANLIWKHPPAVAVLIRLGGIEAVIQSWSFHDPKDTDPLLTSIYGDIVQLLIHPQVVGNSSTLDIISELTKSPVDIALHGLSIQNGPFAEYGAKLAAVLVKAYPSLRNEVLTESSIRHIEQRMKEISPPSNAQSLLELLLELVTYDQNATIRVDPNAIVDFLRRYNGIGGPTCLIALKILSKVVHAATKNLTFAVAECMELNYHDMEIFRSCHSLLSRLSFQDSLPALFDIIRNRSSPPQACLYALATISAFCSIEDRVKPLVDMGVVNILIFSLQSNHQCQAANNAMCASSLAIHSLALLLQQSWPAQVQFRQCSGLRFVRGVKVCCDKIVSANLDIAVALFASSARKEDAIAQLNLCHTALQSFTLSSPALCTKFILAFPNSVLQQVPGLPATLLSILSYYSGIDESVTSAVASILPFIFKVAPAHYSRNVCEVVIMNGLNGDVMRDWRLLSSWLTIIGHCVSHIRQTGPANELLTPEMFTLLLTVSEASNTFQPTLHSEANYSIATQLLMDMMDTAVVAEVAITVLRRQSLDLEEHPLSPSSLSVLLPSGSTGPASVIAFLAIEEHTSMQLYDLQVVSALDAALHSMTNSVESSEREHCCDVLALALQRLSRHVRLRSPIRDSGVLRTLDTMIVNVCPHYPAFVERATRCIKNVSSDSRAPSPSQSKTHSQSRPSSDSNTGALSRFRNIFATVINIGGNEIS